MKKFLLFCFMFIAGKLALFSQSHFDIQVYHQCDSGKIKLINHHPSNGYQPHFMTTTGFRYSWNFGNGQTSTAENPPLVKYSQPGTYNISYSVTIDTVGFYLNRMTVTRVGCTDPFGGKPDVYVIIRDNDGIEVYNTFNNQFVNTSPPYTWEPQILLKNPPYFVWVWDDDPVDGDDNCVDDSENQPGASTLILLPPNNPQHFGTTTYVDTNNMVIVEFEFYKPVLQFSQQKTFTVYSSPAVPTLNYTYGNYHINDPIPPVIASIQNANVAYWYDDSSFVQPIDTGEVFYFHPTGNGTFTFWVRQYNPTSTCYSPAASVTFEIYGAASVWEGHERKPSFSYDNIENSLNLSFFSPTEKIVDIQVFNSLGQVLFKEKLRNYNNSDISINLPNLTDGIYFVKIETSKHQVTGKFVVKH
ncbi:MAG: T9SS type A sorting domain-containing protein [Bacteroidales bacterium]|nr:T9SS type A sorting domain-containing protein [Bacteroidales bacterium]